MYTLLTFLSSRDDGGKRFLRLLASTISELCIQWQNMPPKLFRLLFFLVCSCVLAWRVWLCTDRLLEGPILTEISFVALDLANFPKGTRNAFLTH